jgi:hypothetical protein
VVSDVAFGTSVRHQLRQGRAPICRLDGEQDFTNKFDIVFHGNPLSRAAAEKPSGESIDYTWAMEPATNPFAVMSLIVAPAILTNACSVLVMSTSNRLARAVDRAKELAKQLEAMEDLSAPCASQPLDELTNNETRSLLLLRALQSFYAGLSGFAAAALISLVGAVLAPVKLHSIVQALEITTVLAGFFAVASLIHGSIVLFRETRLAVQLLRDRAAAIRSRRKTHR